MSIGKKVAAVLFCVGAAWCVCAETIAITVIQNEDVPDRALEYTRNLENAVMDALYFDGHIVSNDTIRSTSSGFDDPLYGVEVAKNGRADYLVCIFAKYGDEVKKGSTTDEPDLISVGYRIVNIRTNKAQKGVVIKTSKLKESDADKITARIAQSIEQDVIRRITDDKGRKK